MNNYKGLFTFDVDNHKYIPVEQADGIINDIKYHPEENEEQKSYWVVDYITCGVDNLAIDTKEPEMDDFNKQIGNYFDTREEAEKAVEKLKAWQRLKDKGFKFTDWSCPCRELEFAVDEKKFFKPSGEINKETRADLDLLFGGEE